MSESDKILKLSELINTLAGEIGARMEAEFEQLSQQADSEIGFCFLVFDQRGRKIRAMTSNSQDSARLQDTMIHFLGRLNQQAATNALNTQHLISSPSPSAYIN